MNAREQGFLLLTGHLGAPDRKPLTIAQFRTLSLRAAAMVPPRQERELTESDLLAIGCSHELAQRVLTLLDGQDLLDAYLRRGQARDCCPITRVSPAYPGILRQKLGLDSPGCLWFKGDPSLLEIPAIALVGSRELSPENADFAEEVGRQAALQGLALISGNARGADRIAQESCLSCGGSVISVVADALEDVTPRQDVLYLSENDFDLPFSAQRALSRNRVIHCLGRMTFVAQSSLHTGGTWSGTRQNLRRGWGPVFCFDDGSAAAWELAQRGAVLIDTPDLYDFSKLLSVKSFFDQ